MGNLLSVFPVVNVTLTLIEVNKVSVGYVVLFPLFCTSYPRSRAVSYGD